MSVRIPISGLNDLKKENKEKLKMYFEFGVGLGVELAKMAMHGKDYDEDTIDKEFELVYKELR